MIVDKNNYDIKHFVECKTIIEDITVGKGANRLNHLAYVVKNLLKENGEAMEFGVWRGKTINTISKNLSNQTVYGFDSFEGLPEPWFCSPENYKNPQEMKHKKGFFAVENLPKVNENVKLIKGFFENSLPLWLQNNKIESIKILHIDSDLYSSAKTVLTLLNNYITKGTCIVFDEMCFFENPDKKIKYPLWREGEYKALKEWVEENDRKFEVVSRNKGMQCCIKIVE